MAEAYAMVLRERVVRAYEAGEGSYPVIAARFALGEATVKRWVWRYRRDGQLGPAKKGGGTPSQITAAAVEAYLDSFRKRSLYRDGTESDCSRIFGPSVERSVLRATMENARGDANRWYGPRWPAPKSACPRAGLTGVPSCAWQCS